MGRNLNDIIKSLPAERQEKIKALSQKKVEEMMMHAATLTDFRKAVGKTQVEVAKVLGVKQNAVSQLEKRSDFYISTLRRVLKSFGVTLELAVITQTGTRINLPNFLPWDDTNPTVGASNMPPTRTAKRVSARVIRGPVLNVAATRKVAISRKSAKHKAKKI
jgi:transcriptional regulator with XRE-family HTH domain